VFIDKTNHLKEILIVVVKAAIAALLQEAIRRHSVKQSEENADEAPV